MHTMHLNPNVRSAITDVFGKEVIETPPQVVNHDFATTPSTWRSNRGRK